MTIKTQSKSAPIYSPLESLIFAPSPKISSVIEHLSENRTFTDKVTFCRGLLGISDIYKITIRERKAKFDELLKSLESEVRKQYILEVYRIIIDFNLPRNLYPTINYLIGTGLIFNPPDPIIIWSGQDYKLWNKVVGVNILILESMTVSDLIKYIKNHKDKIRKEMEKIPKIKKIIHHKDRLNIGGFIVILRDSMGKSNKEIADFLSVLDEEHYWIFGASEPISLTEVEVSTYYIREKQNP